MDKVLIGNYLNQIEYYVSKIRTELCKVETVVMEKPIYCNNCNRNIKRVEGAKAGELKWIHLDGSYVCDIPCPPEVMDGYYAEPIRDVEVVKRFEKYQEIHDMTTRPFIGV